MTRDNAVREHEVRSAKWTSRVRGLARRTRRFALVGLMGVGTTGCTDWALFTFWLHRLLIGVPPI